MNVFVLDIRKMRNCVEASMAAAETRAMRVERVANRADGAHMMGSGPVAGIGLGVSLRVR